MTCVRLVFLDMLMLGSSKEAGEAGGGAEATRGEILGGGCQCGLVVGPRGCRGCNFNLFRSVTGLVLTHDMRITFENRSF